MKVIYNKFRTAILALMIPMIMAAGGFLVNSVLDTTSYNPENPFEIKLQEEWYK